MYFLFMIPFKYYKKLLIFRKTARIKFGTIRRFNLRRVSEKRAKFTIKPVFELKISQRANWVIRLSGKYLSGEIDSLYDDDDEVVKKKSHFISLWGIFFRSFNNLYGYHRKIRCDVIFGPGVKKGPGYCISVWKHKLNKIFL